MVHEELISLRRLALQGREVSFTQACLAPQRDGRPFTRNGTVRGATAKALAADGEEVSLTATSLDGRAVAGRVALI